jgi:hypothetical protein
VEAAQANRGRVNRIDVNHFDGVGGLERALGLRAAADAQQDVRTNGSVW